MKPLCVIPARRGSKRLPLKNIKRLAGKPMLVYTIEAAQVSGLFDVVYVSTEDQEIGEIAERYGAKFHRRPEDLAGDLVSASDVCIEVAETCSARGQEYDAVVCLQPSSPLRTDQEIRDSWNKFKSTSSDYLVSVTPVDPHYFHWAVAEKPDGWQMYFGSEFLKERPLLPPVFRPNGAIKIAKVKALCQTLNFFGKPLAVHVMPEETSIHVAEQFDFDMCEFLLNRRAVPAASSR